VEWEGRRENESEEGGGRNRKRNSTTACRRGTLQKRGEKWRLNTRKKGLTQEKKRKRFGRIQKNKEG